MSLKNKSVNLNATIKTLNETIKLLLQRKMLLAQPQDKTIPQCKKKLNKRSPFLQMKPKRK